MAMAATGMLTSRHQRQSAYSVSTPPSSRPTADPPPAIAPYTAKALARSVVSVKRTVSSASAAGASSAPKAPCNARAAKSISPVVARPPRAEASAKPVMPTMKVRLRPQ